jgi:hypothetical protein
LKISETIIKQACIVPGSHKIAEAVSLEAVAGALPERCSGADVRAVVDAARAAAVRRLVAQLHDGTCRELKSYSNIDGYNVKGLKGLIMTFQENRKTKKKLDITFLFLSN